MDNIQNSDSDNNSKSNGCLKGCLIAFIVFIGFIIIVIVGIKIVDHIPRKIAIQENGIYTLELQSTSSPVFPFGPQDGRIVFKENSKKKCKIDFVLSNDGKSMNEDNWNVEWKSDKAVVTIIGEEQKDEKYIIYYNGETESVDSDLYK